MLLVRVRLSFEGGEVLQKIGLVFSRFVPPLLSVRPSVRPTLRRYSLYGKCSELGCDDYDAYLLRCRIFLNVRSLFVRCQWPFLPPHALPSTVPLALVGYGFRVVYLLPYVSYQPHFPVNDIWGI